MEFDRALFGDAVGEVAGVEVGFEAADGDDEFCGLDLFLDLRARNRADVDLQSREEQGQREVFIQRRAENGENE